MVANINHGLEQTSHLWQHHRYRHNLCNHKCWSDFQLELVLHSRIDQRQPGNRNHKSSYYHYLLIGLLAVSPAFAEEDPKVQNTQTL